MIVKEKILVFTEVFCTDLLQTVQNGPEFQELPLSFIFISDKIP